MATATKRKPRAKRPKQRWIPGTEPPSIPKLNQAAEKYFEAMQERCKLSKEEDEAKDSLIDKMKEYGVDRYETPDGLVVTVTARSNCKVKRKNTEESNGESAE